MFSFTPLLGAQTASRASQSILELDGGVKILVDVGWDAHFDTRQLVEIEKHASTLSFILLTHSTLEHLGALVHCCKHIPLFTQIPVYATSPVIAFGRTLLQDLYLSTPLAATFIPSSASRDDASSSKTADITKTNILHQCPTPEEITKYFSLITPLKYSQPHQPSASSFSAPLEGLTLTAYNAGHTLGGTIWHIQHGMESVVYAADWNQARENVMAGAAWFGGVGGSEVIEQLRKPTALVCSSTGADRVAPSGGRKARDEALLAHIRTCLAKGGTVLIPTDSSARILELAWILEKAWREGADDQVLRSSRVYMASKSGQATLRHARSLLEWMDDSIVREFEGDEENQTRGHRRNGSKTANGQTGKPSRPFEFRHIRVLERVAQLDRALTGHGPRVILASDLSFEWGYSKAVLQHIASQSENLVILTERSTQMNDEPNPDLGSKIWGLYDRKEDGVALEQSPSGEHFEQVHTGGRVISIADVQKAALEPSEMEIYQRFVATQRQMQSSLAINDDLPEAADDVLDDDSSSSSDEDEDDEHQGRVLNVSAALGHTSRNKVVISDEDLGISILLRKRGVYDFDVREKKGRNAVFPYVHSRKRGDDFGDYIRPEDFLRAEEREERDNLDESRTGLAVGQKRKWNDANKEKANPPNKRQQIRQGQMANEIASNVTWTNAESDDEELDEEPEPEQDTFDGPAKAVLQFETVTFNARLAFVDFAGLHDQRSLQMLIPLIGPKRLILTSGTTREIEVLAADCKTLLANAQGGTEEKHAAEIMTPVIGQTVDASVDTNAWMVKLSRDLVRKLHWQTVRNIAVVTLTAQLKGEEPVSDDAVVEAKSKKQKLLDSPPTHEDTVQHLTTSRPIGPLLDTMPMDVVASTRSVSQPIHVGDLRLADLRRLMSAAGHLAEFRGEGTLLIDGRIAVRKLATGRIVVEGVPVSAVAAMTATRQPDSFTQVKRKIYEGLAVVAAG